MISAIKISAKYFLISALFYSLTDLNAQKLQSDNGDGTYTNPVIYSDFPDPDVIHIDSIYYMASFRSGSSDII